MKLDKYISELLFNYDCVIVPGLGGFVANYKSATIHLIQNTFSPPSKSISFNKNLTNNDGLLANFIAQKERILFSVASKNIDEAVIAINNELKRCDKFLFKDIGTLFLDAEQRTQFEPQNTINYLLGSYGLSIFQKQPIKKSSVEEKITKEFKDRVDPLINLNADRKSSTKWKVTAAVGIPLAFLAGWMPMQYNLAGDLSYANLNPFTPKQKSVYVPSSSEFILNKVKETSVKNQIALADKNAYFVGVSFDDTESLVVVQLKEKPLAEAVSTYVAPSKKNLGFHIIGGCFSSKSNARKMVKKLKREGFEASIVGKRKGLWTVSYNSFSTRKEAVEALAYAKDHNAKAWVLNQSF
jgi:hypothetical protein